jgi:hypothetical protein
MKVFSSKKKPAKRHTLCEVVCELKSQTNEAHPGAYTFDGT